MGHFVGVIFGAAALSAIQGIVLRRLIQRRRWWIAGSTLLSVPGVIGGFLIGGVIAVLLGLLVPSAANYAFSAGYMMGGGVGGATIAMVHRSAFRPGVQRSLLWVAAWGVGTALGILIALGLPDFRPSLLRGFVAGGVYGIVTAPVLGLLWRESLLAEMV